jgi:hypothetical protein
MSARWLLPLATLTGCYQSLGGGYTHRFGGVPEGHAGEVQYVVAVGAMNDLELAVPMGKIGFATGDWGFRLSNGLGAMVVTEGMARIFWRPALALVFGEERERRDEDSRFFFGLGAEMDGGLLFEVGDGLFIELGGRVGGDLGVTGRGTAAFAGAFLSLGFERSVDFSR